MGYTLSKTAPSKGDPTAKNRVWDFFGEPSKPRPENRRQPLQPRRKIRPCSYKTASGIPYWPSRDPIGEAGGLNLYGFVGNEPIWHIDVLGLATKKPCPFPVVAGHADLVDEREKKFNENKEKCDSGRFYGAACFRSPNGGLVWPTPESRDKRGREGDSTIGELIELKIKEAEADAPKECADKKKCCSKIELKVNCTESPSMKTARKHDPLATKACNYSNTYECPDSKGKGGGWSDPLFGAE